MQSLRVNPNLIALLAGAGFMFYSLNSEIPAAVSLILFVYFSAIRRDIVDGHLRSIYLTATFLLLLFKEWGPWWLSLLIILRSAISGWKAHPRDRYLLMFTMFLLFGPRLMGLVGLGYLGPPISLVGSLVFSVQEFKTIVYLLIKKVKLIRSSSN